MKILLTTPSKIMKERLHEFFDPALKNLPDWYKNLSDKKLSTVNKCPAFIWTFKTSYLIRTPCDIMIKKTGDQILFEPLNRAVMKIDFHDIEYQMSKEQYGDYFAVKVEYRMSIKTSEPVKALFLSPFQMYPENNKLFTSASGVIPYVHKNTPLNIFLFFHKQTIIDLLQKYDNEFVIYKGTPIALLYFPTETLPKIEVKIGDHGENMLHEEHLTLKEPSIKHLSRYFDKWKERNILGKLIWRYLLWRR